MNNLIHVLASELIDKFFLERSPHQRHLLGIAGIPASGKSTFASSLVENINQIVSEEISIAVPMDGFHLPNEILELYGLIELKGIPLTFDAGGFIRLLGKLRSSTNSVVKCPIYDRSTRSSVQDALIVYPYHKIIVVEGNYLLLSAHPWNKARRFFDEVWFLNVDFTIAQRRSIIRHMKWGRTEEEAKRKLRSTDIPNSILIEQTKYKADRIINVLNDQELQK